MDDKILKLYIDVDGVQTSFPLDDTQIEIGVYRYDAKRMGGAPTITASVNYPSCLDDKWTRRVYTIFNTEKHYLKQIPTSSYDSEDAMYKHDLELVSERIALDDIYFFDVVTGSPQESDKPVSNSTKVVFFGNIEEFASRLQASLEYSGLDYEIVIDEGLTEEEKTKEELMSFEDQFFSNVLQEIYNTYEVPYYFVGKEIHIGYANDSVSPPTFAYGVDDALLSITKNNANFKVVNRATGTGSTENIPFYYPNNSPKGEIEATLSTSSSDFSIEVIDMEKYSNEVEIGDVVTRTTSDFEIMGYTYKGQTYDAPSPIPILEYSTNGHINEFYIDIDIDSGNNGTAFIEVNFEDIVIASGQGVHSSSDYKINLEGETGHFNAYGNWILHSSAIKKVGLDNGSETLGFRVIQGYECRIRVRLEAYNISTNYSIASNVSISAIESSGWELNGKEINLSDIGIVSSGIATVGDTITQTLIKYVNTSQTLMPSIYRYTDGAERFYNAVNDKYPFLYEEGYVLCGNEYIDEQGYVQNDAYKDEQGNYYHFNNPYTEGTRREHIVAVEDIKPTIKEAVNATTGLRMDMFSEFAYDDDDNDETYEDEDNTNFKHPYFYGKLRVLDFNLFDHAIENQPMTISFTSGNCGACNFEIGVTDGYPQRNPVQIYEEDTIVDGVLHEAGSLVRDEDGRVVAGIEGTQQQVTKYQESQQDTSKYEVWIALKKEEDTYGILMPKAPKYEINEQTGQKELVEAGHRPKPCTKNEDGTYDDDGDTFVILGIHLPESYITNAEKKLEAEIIKYLKENNDEKFNFSINFSRIYFEENPNILNYLNENSRINITYNGKTYLLYVTSFSYSMGEGDILPEIRVELDDTLTVAQNALQNAINQVKSDVGRALSNIDVLGATSPYFLRKDADDEAQGKINFAKGVKFGEGGKVEIMDNNSAKLTIEYLEVTKKASFTSLEIQEKTHVGGQMLITPAAINCGEVEELDDAYRCYFQTKGADGDEIFNQFAAGDQAICQTFNAWGSKYYWRLVTAIGEDYIDLSKTVCDEDSDIPSAGDKIIQLGNQVDEDRQNAIVIASYGDGSPYIIQYKGIDSFEIPDDKIVTKLSSTENIFTGIVHIQEGSDGFGELGDFAEIIQETVRGVEVGGQNMLRNSGFTGDYLSAQLADEVVLEATDKMFNPPLVHWDGSVNVEVIEEPQSTSGYAVRWDNSGVLIQPLYQKTLASENYIFSFRAKGVATMTARMGGVMGTIELDSANEFKRYVYPFVAAETVNTFVLTLSDEVIMCEPQLERGTIATAWSNSYLDNLSDRAYYQAGVYVNQALHEGSTTIGGGLVLTNHIKVGNYANKEMIQETGGMQGTWTSDDDPFLWGGGTNQQAINAVLQNGEGEDEANFVVTHGGKAILNDAIVRGTVYAQSGVFSGFVKKTPTIVNPSNYQEYLSPTEEPYWYDLDLSKAGSFVIFEGNWADNPHFNMPELHVDPTLNDEYELVSWRYYTYPSYYTVNDVFALIGQKVIVMNNTNLRVQICTDVCSWIEPNEMAVYECEASIVDESVLGFAYWKVHWTTKRLATPDISVEHPV